MNKRSAVIGKRADGVWLAVGSLHFGNSCLKPYPSSLFSIDSQRSVGFDLESRNRSIEIYWIGVWNVGSVFWNEGESRQRVNGVVTSGRKWSGSRLVVVTVMMFDCSRHSFDSETTGVSNVTKLIDALLSWWIMQTYALRLWFNWSFGVICNASLYRLPSMEE